MTRHEIARLACRLMALYLLVQATVYLGTVVLWFASAVMTGGQFSRNWVGESLSQLAPGVSFSIVGLSLWKRSDWIALKLLGDHLSDAAGFEVPMATPITTEPLDRALTPSSSKVHNGLDLSDWTVVGFMVAGVFIFIEGLNAFGGIVYIALTDFRNYQAVPKLLSDRVMTAALKTGMGLWLLLGSRGIVRMIRRMRTKY